MARLKDGKAVVQSTEFVDALECFPREVTDPLMDYMECANDTYKRLRRGAGDFGSPKLKHAVETVFAALVAAGYTKDSILIRWSW